MGKISQKMERLFGALVLVSILGYTGVEAQETAATKLVLQITVDGLRADIINRDRDRFVDGGFNYLLKNGAIYTNAFYQHANTETIVGHATLATGAFLRFME